MLIAVQQIARRSVLSRRGLSLMAVSFPRPNGVVGKRKEDLCAAINSLISQQTRYGSHERTMYRRHGQMMGNRFKDALQFYLVGLGVLPLGLLLFVAHVIFGNCELTDYPAEGEPPPRFWQFERTPLRQFYQRMFGLSEMEYFERNMSLCERRSILIRWRRFEQRVRHLIGERWDYKAYYYMPISATWVDHGRNMTERLHYQYEEHGHYAS